MKFYQGGFSTNGNCPSSFTYVYFLLQYISFKSWWTGITLWYNICSVFTGYAFLDGHYFEFFSIFHQLRGVMHAVGAYVLFNLFGTLHLNGEYFMRAFSYIVYAYRLLFDAFTLFWFKQRTQLLVKQMYRVELYGAWNVLPYSPVSKSPPYREGTFQARLKLSSYLDSLQYHLGWCPPGFLVKCIFTRLEVPGQLEGRMQNGVTTQFTALPLRHWKYNN